MSHRRKGQKQGFFKGKEIGDNYATILTISQSKRFNEGSQEIKGREPGMQGREGDGLDPLVPSRSEGKKAREARSCNFEEFKKLYLKRQGG